MKKIIFLFLLFFFFWGCSTYETKETKIEQLPSADLKQTVEEKKVQENPLSEKAKETASGSPMGAAVQSIKKAEEDMTETIKLVEELRKGDQFLDFRNNRASSFKTLQTFFGSSCFSYDEYTFWFMTQGDKKISVWEEDGFLEKGTTGLFMSFKRLVAIQVKDNQETETEFYVDSTKKELMVHRFHKNKTTNENYILFGK